MRLKSYISKISTSAKSFFESDFIRKVLETYFVQISTLGINFLSIVFFSRILGPTARGMLATALAITALGVQFGNIGLHSSNTYFVAKDRALLSVIVGNTCTLSLAIGSLIAIFIWSGVLIEPSLVPINGYILLLASLLIPLGLAQLLFQNILIGIQEIRAYNKIEIFVRSFIFLFVCALFWLKIRSVEVILLANLLALIFGLFFTWRKLRSYLQEKPSFSTQFLKRSLAYGFRSYIAAFLAFLVIRIDLLMVKHILGFEQAGYYSIAANIADILSVLPVIVGTLLFPKIVAISDEKIRLKIVKKVALGVLVMMCLISLCCLLFSKMVILSLLGESFLPSVPAFLWLLPGLTLLAVNVIFMNYFASVGLPWIVLASPGLAASANILMNLKMIPALGIAGASISSSICYGSMLMMSLVYLRYFTRAPQIDTSPELKPQQ